MRELVAFVYPDAFRAAEVIATLGRLRPASSPDLNDAVCVTHDLLGSVKLHYAQCPSREASDVRFWRTLIGSLVSSAPAGTTGGAAGDPARRPPPEYGIDDAFSAEVCAQLTPGTSAVFVLVRDVTSDRLVPHVSAFGGTILRTPLPAGAEPRQAGFRPGAPGAPEREGATPPIEQDGWPGDR
jgi:uncharacterized membrane protein